MGDSQRILVVDDNPAVREGLRRTLHGFGYAHVDEAADAESALPAILETYPDLVVVDLNLPARSGLELIADLQEQGVDTTMVVLTAHGSIDSALEATRRGVFDYLLKPISPERLRAVVERGLERTAMRRELVALRREMLRSGRLQKMVGSSPVMRQVYRTIEQVAPTPVSVLVTGESGTGKELVARTVHALSPRSGRPLVAVNCAAIPGSLLESELFGHEKGAFTGATSSRAGCFEQAEGGTLFLDEIGEMPADLQSKLLRVLEDRKLRRVGGEREIAVDVRIVSATNVPFASLRREGRIREDLYFRLNVFHVDVPPLRERAEDIPLLAERFLEECREEGARGIAGFSQAALARMRAHRWPGNVRELRNAVQRAAILCPGGEIQPEHLPAAVGGAEEAAGPGPEPGGGGRRDGAASRTEPPATGRDGRSGVWIPTGTTLNEAEKALILETLRAQGGNKTRAAQTLGISLKTLYTRLNAYEAARANEGP